MAAKAWILAALLAAWESSHQVSAGESPEQAPACEALVAQPPVDGTFHQRNVTSSGTAWEWVLKDGCRYPLWESQEMADCLKGAWVVIVGASNSNLWIMQLANMLAPGALLTKRDHFTIDGASTQMIDIIIDGGEVVHRKVLVDEQAIKNRYGSHTYARDHEVLRNAFAQVGNATAYSSSAIRITNFLAEYWDGVELSMDAVESAKDWAQAEVTMVVSIGLWYMNAMNCWWSKRWCATRPPYNPPHMKEDEMFEQFDHGMQYAVSKLQPFCSHGGRAGHLGCVVTSIEHCPFSTGPLWTRLYHALRNGMERVSTASLRFVDVWTLTLSLPEGTIGEHQSPMSTLFTWQVLLGGICSARNATPSEGSIAVFSGSMCRAEQVADICSDEKAHVLGFRFSWECAMTDLCTLQAVNSTLLAPTGSTEFFAIVDDAVRLNDHAAETTIAGEGTLRPGSSKDGGFSLQLASSISRALVLAAVAAAVLGLAISAMQQRSRSSRAEVETAVAYSMVREQA